MSAVLSDCEQYRYELHRNVSLLTVTPPVLFIGVNPSTADAENNDATIRKMIGFTQRWGYSRFMVGNVFAYRATDVNELHCPSRDVVGPLNYAHIKQMLAQCSLVVPCWGDRFKVPRHLHAYFDVMRQTIAYSGKPACVFGFTKRGDPLHPLMLSYETPLQGWTNL